MIYGPEGNVEPPAGMVQRLQEVDPHLDMIFGGASRAWWIVWRWPENDPRRAWIKQGKRPANRAFDMWCKLPADCSADNAYAYLVSHMQAHRGLNGIGKMLDRVHSYNKKQERENVREEAELGEELIAANSGLRHAVTAAPRTKNTDRKRLRDFLYDTGVAV